MKAAAGLITALWAAALAVAAPPPDAPLGRAPNLFHELLGRSEAETDARIAAAWQQLFYGADDSQRVYYPVGADEAYIADVANHDVRTEGLSYGMMLCVQLDHRPEFDRIWKWARAHLYHETGPLRGYFAWHASLDGRPLDPGPAPDGEEWFVTSLFLAARRWGQGEGLLDYEAQAQALLHTMLHKADEPGHDDIAAMFDPGTKMVRFTPDGVGIHFTDPSYQLPAFYELWARWAAAPEDRAFCAAAADASRAFFPRAANATTGLMPDYADFDGSPHARRGHGDFRYDAWRTLANVALDYAWFRADPWEAGQSDRVLRFLAAQGPECPGLFTLDGKALSTTHARGLAAMAAVAGLAADPKLARPFVERLWTMPIPDGPYRYYDGLLYFLALLEAGGRFQSFLPAGAPAAPSAR